MDFFNKYKQLFEVSPHQVLTLPYRTHSSKAIKTYRLFPPLTLSLSPTISMHPPPKNDKKNMI